MKRFLKQSWLDFKGQRAAFSLEEFALMETMYPFVTMVFYCLVAGYAFRTTNLSRWIVGNAFLLCTNTCVFSLGSCFMGERYYGRIRSIITAPISKLEVILEKGFFPCMICIITTFVGFGVGSIVFHVNWSGVNIGLFLVILLIGMASAVGFGLFLATLGLISDQMHLILNLVANLLVIFCGANFPISQLPAAGQLISKLLPLTRSIEASQLLLEGKIAFEQVLSLLLGELGVGAVYVILAFCVVKSAERVAIRKGTLELF